MCPLNNRKAFTLVEVIVILAVIAILAAIAIPVALRIFQVTAEEATREEMDNIKKAIIGDARKLQSSFRSDFGFLGDIGCLPTVLDRLLTADGLPTPFSFDSTKQAGAGWKGPYITGTPGEVFTTDQLGNPYTYTVPAGPCPLTATLTSNGPDGQPTTPDDITLSITATDTTATVRGKVKDTAEVGLEAVPVEFYSPVNGTLTITTATTNANGEYAFSSVPFGSRAVKALPRLVLAPGSVVQTGGGRHIAFKVINYSESAYTITQIRADYSGNANYDTILIDGATVDAGVDFKSGQTVNVTPTTIAASPATRPSMRVVVDSVDMQLPDITVSGQGTPATIELKDFNQDMIGIPFTVTFNRGARQSVVKFTP